MPPLKRAAGIEVIGPRILFCRCTQPVYFHLNVDDANGWKYAPVTRELYFFLYPRIISKNVFANMVQLKNSVASILLFDKETIL